VAASYPVGRVAFSPPPAKFSVWKNVGRCELWEAVVLTLGHEPRFFEFHPESGRELIVAAIHLAFMPENAAYQTGLELVDEIHDRLVVAKSNAGKKFKIGESYRSVSHAAVDLAEFGRWAEGVWPPLPPGFPSDEVPPVDATQMPLATKERTSLLVVIAALAKRADIAWEQPTMAAKTIAETARDELGVRIGARTIEEILKKIDEALDRKDP